MRTKRLDWYSEKFSNKLHPILSPVGVHRCIICAFHRCIKCIESYLNLKVLWIESFLIRLISDQSRYYHLVIQYPSIYELNHPFAETVRFALVFTSLTTHCSDYSGRHVEYEFDIVCCTFIPVFIFLRNVLEMHSQFVQHRYLLEET